MVLVEPYFSQDFWALGALALGIALDLIFGHPRGWPDPIRGIVWLSRLAERGLRVATTQNGGGLKAERIAGVVLTIVVVGLVASLVGLLADLLTQLGGPTNLIGRALLIYWALSIKILGRQALRASAAPSLFLARRELAVIDWLDTSKLDSSGINRVCIETISSKATGSIIGPLFWLAVLGPAGLWGYQAIKMLDLRFQARTIPDLNFAWATNRLNSLANLVPLRLTWLLIAISAALLNEDGFSAWKWGWRDGRKFRGPRSPWAEAAMAGALGIQLGGVPGSGGPSEPIGRSTVQRSVRILRVVTLHAVALTLAVRILVFGG